MGIKHQLEYFVKHITLIPQGERFSDKLTLLYNSLLAPIRQILKITCLPVKQQELIKDVTLKNRKGKFYCGKNVFYVWNASSFHERSVFNELKKMEKGIFLDIGAHIGSHAIGMANHLRKNGKVIAVEPEKENLKYLKINKKINNLKNLEIIDGVCSEKDGYKILHLKSLGTAQHSLVRDFKEKDIKVKSYKIDTLVKNLKKIHTIKIDVEGAEDLTIKGALKTIKKYKPKIIFESPTLNDLTTKKVKKLLTPLGYSLKLIYKDTYHSNWLASTSP